MPNRSCSRVRWCAPLMGIVCAAVTSCTGSIGDASRAAAPGGGDAQSGGGGAGAGALSSLAGAGASSFGSASALGRSSADVLSACRARGRGPKPGALLNRRLTRWEYDNTVRDLLGDTSRPASTSFPVEEQLFGFDTIESVHSVSPVLAEQYLDTAETLATNAIANIGNLVTCDRTKVGDTACARTFVSDFGKRAFRRPLASDEVDLYMTAFNAGAVVNFNNGIKLVIEALLQSEPFLYRIEIGTPVANNPGVVALGPWEIAARLSYLLWGSTPDTTLLAAAESGALVTPAHIGAQVMRMLADDRAKQLVRDFNEQWLGLGALATLQKDSAAYPDFASALVPAMQSQFEAFVDDVTWGAGGTLSDFFTSTHGFANTGLAKLYGWPSANLPSTTMAAVALDPTRYAGALTLGPLLSVNAKSNSSSPILRGKFVRTRLFCETLPAPPPNVPPPPVVDKNSTTRERFAQHTANPQCASCHQLIDPVGWGLENFDGVGRWRDTENGQPIDASGELKNTDVDGNFVGPVAMAARLAKSPTVEQCVVTSWFRFGYGRVETDNDACSLEALDQAFVTSGFKLADVLVALTTNEEFTLRTIPDDSSAASATQGGMP